LENDKKINQEVRREMTPLDVILAGLRNALADDESMAFWEERRKEKERFRWYKCQNCGWPYRVIGDEPCPYCRARR
jgi:rubrerythrin